MTREYGNDNMGGKGVITAHWHSSSISIEGLAVAAPTPLGTAAVCAYLAKAKAKANGIVLVRGRGVVAGL